MASLQIPSETRERRIRLDRNRATKDEMVGQAEERHLEKTEIARQWKCTQGQAEDNSSTGLAPRPACLYSSGAW
jgi:hypothetical protein